MTPARPVVRLTTGLLDTVVLGADVGSGAPASPAPYTWTRRCGAAAPAPFARVPASVRSTLAARTGTLRWVVGTGGPRVRHYRVRGHLSAAALLLGDDGSVAAGTVLPTVLGDLGRALHDLHRTTPPSATDLDAPRGPARLRRWLEGRAPELPAARAAGLVRDRIGAATWRRLRDRLAGLSDAGPAVLSHGMCGLGSVVAATDPTARTRSTAAPSPLGADVLIGEDLTLAPAAWDVGCVLAELIEDRWRGRDPEVTAAAMAAFERGLGRGLDGDHTSAAILRIALHLHDYVAYVAFDPAEIDRYADLLGHLLARFPAGAAVRGTG